MISGIQLFLQTRNDSVQMDICIISMSCEKKKDLWLAIIYMFYRLCYRSSHSLCLSVDAAIRLHSNFRLVRLHCTGSVETPGFTLKSPSRFSFFCWQRSKEKMSSKIFLLEEKRALSPLVLENIRCYQENLHSCFSSESSVPRAFADRFVRVK
jgi:hypothetical protein